MKIIEDRIGWFGFFGWLLLSGVSDAVWGTPNDAKEQAQQALVEVREHIDAATSRGEGTNWVSQPGAISVQSTDPIPSSVYKLYTSKSPLALGSDDLGADVPADWNEQPAHYVDLNEPEVRNGEMEFPIADPRAEAEGFSYTPDVNGVTSERLPMPVMWQYILRDGTTGYLDSNRQFVGARIPTAENPIVARKAYWTDDNTSRINVNTASEGVYWDTPRVNTLEDRNYGRFQPANGEYQRYPGHPARVSMSSVIQPGKRYHLPDAAESKMDSLDLETTRRIWKAARGISEGGSMGGTEVIDISNDTAVAPSPDQFRSYGDPRDLAAFLSDEEASRVKRGQFFLTTTSRSPDLNLFGQPRITTWPVPTNISNRSIYDRAVADLSLVNRGSYFFQRQSSDSRHNEYYGNAGGRNYLLFQYLQEMTNSTVPGYPGSFAEKHGRGRFDEKDQILAQAFGYFKSANLSDGTNNRWQYTDGKFNSASLGHGQVVPSCLCGGTGPHQNRWFRTNVQAPWGSGRFGTLSEISLFMICRAERTLGGKIRGSQTDIETFNLQPGQKLIQVGLLVEVFAPSQGMTPWMPDMGVTYDGGTGSRNTKPPANLSLNGHSLEWPSSAELNSAPKFVRSESRPPEGATLLGGSTGVRTFDDVMSFAPIVIDSSAEALQFSGVSENDPLRIVLFDNRASTFDVPNIVQSFRLVLPQASFPTPNFWSPEEETARNTFADRMEHARRSSAADLFHPDADVVQSMVPRHGDYRLLYERRVIEADVFVPHRDYGKKRLAHSLVDSDGPLPGATFERELIPGAGYAPNLVPDFPRAPGSEGFAVSSDPAITGDWDSGVGPTPDGAYMNKSDDGDARGLEAEGTPYFDNLTDKAMVASANFVPERKALPGLLGSLPTGVRSDVPWRTLLFRPDTSSVHFGAADPPDHLLMDLFRLPVVGPKQNSDTFSTDGRVNLNYQIVPFTYIHRSTALHSVFKSEKVLAVPTNAGATYKSEVTDSPWRRYIDASQTLQQWEEKFAKGERFRSATEICEMHLVPEGEQWQGADSMNQFWQEHALTGDNVRERPYANLHAMLTTRSNSFQVHVKAQMIEKSSETSPGEFDPELDAIADTWSGKGQIQRFIDPEDDRISDVAREMTRGTDIEPVSSFYQTLLSLEEPDAPFRITEVGIDASIGGIVLSWNSRPGEVYGIETSADLSSWRRVDDSEAGMEPFYRGLPSQGYQTKYSFPIGNGLPVAVRVVRQ